MRKQKIAVFASGSGSNFEVAAREAKAGRIDGEVALLVSDKPAAAVVGKAKAFHIPVLAFNPKGYASKQEFEQEIFRQLQEQGIEWIVLAGYMRLIGPTLLEPYQNRIINIHPSLLPAFPGKDAIGQALSAGVKVTGVTVHYVDEGMDTGLIIAQEAVKIGPGEDRASLQARIQEVEHRLFPQTIQSLLSSKKGIKS